MNQSKTVKENQSAMINVKNYYSIKWTSEQRILSEIKIYVN